MKFQAYVRQRLAEMELRMPPKPSAREEAELAFLEKEVIEDHMSPKRRALRDPLKDVKIEEITHTNLPLICRFVSEGGSILSPKLTGVSKDKQKALAKAIKRARQVTRAYAQAPRFPPRLQPPTRHARAPAARPHPLLVEAAQVSARQLRRHLAARARLGRAWLQAPAARRRGLS